MKQILGLIIAVAVGVAGGFLFSRSMPPEPGSLEDRVELAEAEAKRSQRMLESLTADAARRKKGSVQDRVRQVMRDIRDGKEVSPDEIFYTMKPWLRDMAPIFERIRKVNQDEWADSLSGQWAREYDLTPQQQERLKKHFQRRNQYKSAHLTTIIARDDTGFVDLMQATEYDWRDAARAEDEMEKILTGDDLKSFQEKRMEQRVESVQSEADRNLTRLDNIVELDSQQHQELFGVMARGSEDFRPGLEYDGMAGNDQPLNKRQRDNEIRKVLRPDQVQLLEEHRAERKAEAEKDLVKMGLSLPKDWDLLEGDTF